MARKLADHHYHMLSVESGISDECIELGGFWTAYDYSEIIPLGFKGPQCRVPALVIPLYGPNGEQNRWQIRPDNPRLNDQGKPVKYEYPKGYAPVLDCTNVPLVRETLKDPTAPIFITEGFRKAYAAASRGIPCLSLAGVWNWKGKDEHGGVTCIAELDMISWRDRPIFIVFDNDALDKAGVHAAMQRLAGRLKRADGQPKFTLLPYDPTKKIGLDDYLVSGGTADKLFNLSTTKIPRVRGAGYDFNDLGVARRIRDLHGDELIFDTDLGTWFTWHGTHWVRDRKGLLVQGVLVDYISLLQDELAGMPLEDKDDKEQWAQFNRFVTGYGNAKSLRDAEHVLRVESATIGHEWDSKPHLLNCANGTLDLQTMDFYPNRPDDYLTVTCPTPYDPSAQCPMWEAFMAERFPSLPTREYIQMIAGQFVTGYNPEKVFFILRGDKNCGKTQFVECMQKLLGEYANKVGKETLMKQKGGRGQEEKSVELVGRRMIYVDESSNNDKIDEAFIKEITGGDATIKARRLFEQAFSAKAQFTLILATNFKPYISGNDDAIWDRCRLIEFGTPIPVEKRIGAWSDTVIASEASGVLNWMIEGYQKWRKVGRLVAPPEVEAWTSQYRMDNDPLGRFLSECYEFDPDTWEFCSDVHQHYLAWAADTDTPVQSLDSPSRFGSAIWERWGSQLGKRGTKKRKQGKTDRVFPGLRAIVDFRSTEGVAEAAERE